MPAIVFYGLIILLAAVVVWVVLVAVRRGGFGKHNAAKREKVEAGKEQILEAIKKYSRLTNDEVQKLLGVSDSTATRYLKELEAEGKIVARGEASNTYYEIQR